MKTNTKQPSRRWRWVCECCYRTTSAPVLPSTWKLVYQSAICPKCIREATVLNIGYANLRGGQWAGLRKDPRAQSPESTASAVQAAWKALDPTIRYRCGKEWFVLGWQAAMRSVWDRLPMPEFAQDPMTPREVAKLADFVRTNLSLNPLGSATEDAR